MSQSNVDNCQKKPSHSQAVEIAHAMEAANVKAKSFKDTATIQQISSMPGRNSSKPCYRWGRTSHGPAACKFKDATCNYCGKTGHISTACHAKGLKAQTTPKETEKKSHKKQASTHCVQ